MISKIVASILMGTIFGSTMLGLSFLFNIDTNFTLGEYAFFAGLCYTLGFFTGNRT